MSSTSQTYICGIEHGKVHPVGPVDKADGLCAVLEVIFVNTLVNFLDFVALEDIGGVSPIAMLNVVDL